MSDADARGQDYMGDDSAAWLTALVARTLSDVSAPFGEIDRLAHLDVATYQGFLAQLKQTRCSVPALDKAVNARRREIEAAAKAARKAERARSSSGFEMTSFGLFYADPDEDERPQFICSHFVVKALCCDSDSNSWGFLLRWQDQDGAVHQWTLPWSMLGGDGAAIAQQFGERGLRVTPTKTARVRLMLYLDSTSAVVAARTVLTTGWYGKAFVLPDEALGDCRTERVVMRTDHVAAHDYYEKGTLKDWQDNLATHALGNTRLVFAICIAFAAALVGPCEAESGGVHYVGRSSRGKTTALIIAGSVWGGDPHGRRLYHKQWKATANGLEGVAAAHNGALLCLDDIKQATAKEVGAVIYMLANTRASSGRTGTVACAKPPKGVCCGSRPVKKALPRRSQRTIGRGKRPGSKSDALISPRQKAPMASLMICTDSPTGEVFADHLREAGKRYFGAASRINIIAPELDAIAAAVRVRTHLFVAR